MRHILIFDWSLSSEVRSGAPCKDDERDHGRCFEDVQGNGPPARRSSDGAALTRLLRSELFAEFGVLEFYGFRLPRQFYFVLDNLLHAGESARFHL